MKNDFFNLCATVFGIVLAVQHPDIAIAGDHFRVLYSFHGGTDGAGPQSGVIQLNGALYGTTGNGGTNSACGDEHCGTVFAIDPKTGAETLLYSFCSEQNCADGWDPQAGLVAVKGTLYGVTYQGGAGGKRCLVAGYPFCGVVFSIDPATATETVVHSFAGYRTDGANPRAGLIDVDGALYGTTIAGGSYNRNCGYGLTEPIRGCGSVFELDPDTGAETVLHSFQYNVEDGYAPYAGLIAVKGILYGTTSVGGDNTGCGIGDGNGCGSVFSLDSKTGAEKVLYSFCSRYKGGVCTDGTWPYGGLIDVNGMLYGTTENGGRAGKGGTLCSDYGCGTVFSLDPSTGTETVIYSFCSQQDCADGRIPQAALIDVGGTLYGTASEGGLYRGGTLFSLVPATGKMTVLHSFGQGCAKSKCKDGFWATSNLIDVKGTLYGTTSAGGAYMAGTVFAITP